MAYIDVDKLIDKINSRIKNTLIRGWLASIINETIEETPNAGVVKVVRRKDCKHQEQCYEFIMISGKDKNIDFCSYGERKEDNDKVR